MKNLRIKVIVLGIALMASTIFWPTPARAGLPGPYYGPELSENEQRALQGLPPAYHWWDETGGYHEVYGEPFTPEEIRNIELKAEIMNSGVPRDFKYVANSYEEKFSDDVLSHGHFIFHGGKIYNHTPWDSGSVTDWEAEYQTTVVEKSDGGDLYKDNLYIGPDWWNIDFSNPYALPGEDKDVAYFLACKAGDIQSDYIGLEYVDVVGANTIALHVKTYAEEARRRDIFVPGVGYVPKPTHLGAIDPEVLEYLFPGDKEKQQEFLDDMARRGGTVPFLGHEDEYKEFAQDFMGVEAPSMSSLWEDQAFVQDRGDGKADFMYIDELPEDTIIYKNSVHMNFGTLDAAVLPGSWRHEFAKRESASIGSVSKPDIAKLPPATIVDVNQAKNFRPYNYVRDCRDTDLTLSAIASWAKNTEDIHEGFTYTSHVQEKYGGPFIEYKHTITIETILEDINSSDLYSLPPEIKDAIISWQTGEMELNILLSTIISSVAPEVAASPAPEVKAEPEVEYPEVEYTDLETIEELWLADEITTEQAQEMIHEFLTSQPAPAEPTPSLETIEELWLADEITTEQAQEMIHEFLTSQPAPPEEPGGLGPAPTDLGWVGPTPAPPEEPGGLGPAPTDLGWVGPTPAPVYADGYVEPAITDISFTVSPIFGVSIITDNPPSPQAVPVVSTPSKEGISQAWLDLFYSGALEY